MKRNCHGYPKATIYEHKEAPGLNFINVLHTAFTLEDPKKRKKDSQVVNLFYAFGIYERKSCRYNVDEIEPLSGDERRGLTIRAMVLGHGFASNLHLKK